MKVTPTEAYALAQFGVGGEWRSLQIGPLLRQMLDNAKQQDSANILRVLGPDIAAQVLEINPDAPIPTKSEEDDLVHIPELPEAAQLSEAALLASEGVGKWVDDFMCWAIKRSPMTPPDFLRAGAIWVIGLAAARRCSVNLNFKRIYPHLYVLWISRSSIYKKTTGLDIFADLIDEAMPHMLMPEDNTPESFISTLGGKPPSNYDALGPYEQGINNLGRRFAAQRGVLLDEASSLLGASRKDYMQGLEEMIRRLYDAPDRHVRNTRSEGTVIIRNASLCIMGGTTPGDMRRNVNIEAWETGTLARYALLFPDKLLPYDKGTGDNYTPPSDIVGRLKSLHHLLPAPPDELALKASEPPKPEILTALMSKEAFACYDAYARAVTYDMLLTEQNVDPQLQANYSRLHIQAVKVAESLALADWADGKGKGPVTVSLGHWAKAQQIVEGWRVGLHRLAHELTRSTDDLDEKKLLNHLSLYPDGETLRDLTRRTKIDRKRIQDALKSLNESGLVEGIQSPGGRTLIYRRS